MTFISNSRAEELAKTLATTKTTISQPLEKQQEKSTNENPIKQSSDEIEINNSSKSETPIVNMFEDSIDSKIQDLRKNIMAGKKVEINLTDFPGMSQEKILKKIFPDAQLKSREPESDIPIRRSIYKSKEVGTLQVIKHESGCFNYFNGITIQKIDPKPEIKAPNSIEKSNSSRIEALKKDIMSGKEVNIKYSDFPNMSKNQIIKSIFPDAKLLKSHSEHPFSYSSYSSKDVSKLDVSELVGGFVSSNGFSIKKGKITLEDLKLENNEPKVSTFPDLKPIPKVIENSEPNSDENVNINTKSILNELDIKGQVYVKHSDFNYASDEKKIKALFPNATIQGSNYERPYVTINFTDEKGNKYQAQNMVDGIIASQGITISKVN